MKAFNILLHDINKNQVEIHDIMPYLLDTYNKCLEKGHWWPCYDPFKKPTSYEELRDFVKYSCMHMYWARSQYEWLMLPWPSNNLDLSIKIDAWQQIEMNLDVVTDVFIENIQ